MHGGRLVDDWPRHVAVYVKDQLASCGIELEKLDLGTPTVVQRGEKWEPQYFCSFVLDGTASEVDPASIRAKFDFDVEAQFNKFCKEYSYTLMVTVQTPGARLLLKDGWNWKGSMNNDRWDLGEYYTASMPGLFQLGENEDIPDEWDMSKHGPSNLLTFAQLLSFHIAMPKGCNKDARPFAVSPCVYARFYNEETGAFTRIIGSAARPVSPGDQFKLDQAVFRNPSSGHEPLDELSCESDMLNVMDTICTPAQLGFRSKAWLDESGGKAAAPIEYFRRKLVLERTKVVFIRCTKVLNSGSSALVKDFSSVMAHIVARDEFFRTGATLITDAKVQIVNSSRASGSRSTDRVHDGLHVKLNTIIVHKSAAEKWLLLDDAKHHGMALTGRLPLTSEFLIPLEVVYVVGGLDILDLNYFNISQEHFDSYSSKILGAFNAVEQNTFLDPRLFRTGAGPEGGVSGAPPAARKKRELNNLNLAPNSSFALAASSVQSGVHVVLSDNGRPKRSTRVDGTLVSDNTVAAPAAASPRRGLVPGSRASAQATSTSSAVASGPDMGMGKTAVLESIQSNFFHEKLAFDVSRICVFDTESLRKNLRRFADIAKGDDPEAVQAINGSVPVTVETALEFFSLHIKDILLTCVGDAAAMQGEGNTGLTRKGIPCFVKLGAKTKDSSVIVFTPLLNQIGQSEHPCNQKAKDLLAAMQDEAWRLLQDPPKYDKWIVPQARTQKPRGSRNRSDEQGEPDELDERTEEASAPKRQRMSKESASTAVQDSLDNLDKEALQLLAAHPKFDFDDSEIDTYIAERKDQGHQATAIGEVFDLLFAQHEQGKEDILRVLEQTQAATPSQQELKTAMTTALKEVLKASDSAIGRPSTAQQAELKALKSLEGEVKSLVAELKPIPGKVRECHMELSKNHGAVASAGPTVTVHMPDALQDMGRSLDETKNGIGKLTEKLDNTLREVSKKSEQSQNGPIHKALSQDQLNTLLAQVEGVHDVLHHLLTDEVDSATVPMGVKMAHKFMMKGLQKLTDTLKPPAAGPSAAPLTG